VAFGVVALVRLLGQVPRTGWLRIAAALGATTLRTAVTVALAAAWAVPAGIAIGRSPRLAPRLEPAIQMLASFPAPMLYPLVTGALLALGLPFSLVAVALMLLGAQWYVLFNVIAGASAIPGDLREAADAFRLAGWRRWRTLELPAVFPYLVTGLITAAGGAWNASIVAELVHFRGRTLATTGLGALITEATAAGDFPLLAAGVLTMALAVVGVNRLGWRRLYRLAETRYALAR
jgi:NitT/TauT family transport system permease protein